MKQYLNKIRIATLLVVFFPTTLFSSSVYKFDSSIDSGVVRYSQADEEKPLSTYPNPVQSRLSIDFQVSKDGVIFELYSISGQKLKSISLGIGTKHEVDLSDLKNGMYFIKITDGQNSYTRKVVKHSY